MCPALIETAVPNLSKIEKVQPVKIKYFSPKNDAQITTEVKRCLRYCRKKMFKIEKRYLLFNYI